MKNLLVTLMIAFVLFTSSPAEAGRASVIKKILDKVVDSLKEKPTVKKKSGDEGGNIYNLGEEGAEIIYDLDEDGARKRLESKRDEEKTKKEEIPSEMCGSHPNRRPCVIQRGPGLIDRRAGGKYEEGSEKGGEIFVTRKKLK